MLVVVVLFESLVEVEVELSVAEEVPLDPLLDPLLLELEEVDLLLLPSSFLSSFSCCSCCSSSTSCDKIHQYHGQPSVISSSEPPCWYWGGISAPPP